MMLFYVNYWRKNTASGYKVFLMCIFVPISNLESEHKTFCMFFFNHNLKILMPDFFFLLSKLFYCFRKKVLYSRRAELKNHSFFLSVCFIEYVFYKSNSYLSEVKTHID